MANDAAATPGAACPVCDRATAEVSLPITRSSPHLLLDVCTRCQFVWFDPREFEHFPSAAAEPKKELPLRAREQLAMIELQRVAEQAERENNNEPGPDDAWKWLPAIFGMPVEENAPAIESWPWLTYGLAAALAIVFALTATNLNAVIEACGLVPSQLWRHGGATLITSFFLHGGLFHLIGNVYFLLIFGDNVEDDLGGWRYAGLIAAAAIIGDACHILDNLHSATPCIGASGGISGIITYYALRFPHARLGLLVRFYWMHLPAYVALLLWFVLQFWLAFEQHIGTSNVAALAHLGGAATGVAAWLVWRVRERRA